MEEGKYYLVLTGELSQGQNREEAESALGRLLRMPPEKAGSLLRGKPSRIHKSLAGEKAQHLLKKMLACGVRCRLEPVSSEETADPPADRQIPGMRGRPLGRRSTTQDETVPEPGSAQDTTGTEPGPDAELSGQDETDPMPAMEAGAVTPGSDMPGQPPEQDHSLELEFIEQEPAGAAETPADQATESQTSRETPDSAQDIAADLSLDWESMPEAREKPAEEKPGDEKSEQESPAVSQDFPPELELVEPEQAEAEPQSDELTLDPEPPREGESATGPALTELSMDLDLADSPTAEQKDEASPNEGEGNGGLAAEMSEIVLETPPPIEKRTRTQPIDDAVNVEAPQFFAQPEPSQPRKSEPEKKARGGLDRKWIIVAGVLVLLVLVAGAWVGMGLFSSDDKKSVASRKAVSISAEKKVQPKGPVAVTKEQQNMLARSVKIWMIQYGAGFDPGQVTLAGLEQDLQISPGQMQDGWGTLFRYEPRADRYLIISAGPDRQFDTADDLSKEFKIDTGGGSG